MASPGDIPESAREYSSVVTYMPEGYNTTIPAAVDAASAEDIIVNWDGIRLQRSNNNNIMNNNANANNNHGIYFDFSNSSTVTSNTAMNNSDGIHLRRSYNNNIYFNNFIDNSDNVCSYKSPNIRNSTEKMTYEDFEKPQKTSKNAQKVYK